VSLYTRKVNEKLKPCAKNKKYPVSRFISLPPAQLTAFNRPPGRQNNYLEINGLRPIPSLQTHVHGPSPKTAVFAFVVSILAIAVAVDAIEPNLLTICPPFLLEIRIETTATSTFLPRMLRLKRPLLYHYQKRRRMSSIPPPPIFLSLVPRTMHHLLKISHSFIFTPRFYLYSRQQSGVNRVPLAAQSQPVSPLHLAHETGRTLNNVVTPRRRGGSSSNGRSTRIWRRLLLHGAI
jgi:hypothetical protein